jgi:hypothetical protein
MLQASIFSSYIHHAVTCMIPVADITLQNHKQNLWVDMVSECLLTAAVVATSKMYTSVERLLASQ